MGMYREPDPLADLLMREHARVLQCLTRFADGEGAAALAEAREVVQALAEAEVNVLYPAFSLVSPRPETQRLLDDSRGARADQLAALHALAHKRAARVRKVGAVALSDTLQRHAQEHIALLIPVLSSQMPRVRYRSIVSAFTNRYEGALVQRPVARRQRALMSA